jgi:hypothetical protein
VTIVASEAFSRIARDPPAEGRQRADRRRRGCPARLPERFRKFECGPEARAPDPRRAPREDGAQRRQIGAGISVRASSARTPAPLTRRAHNSSCISAARLKTSARRSQSPPPIRSGAVYGRRTGGRRRSVERAGDAEPVRRVSSDDSRTSRGCSAPCGFLDRGGEVERAGQLGGDAQAVARRRRAVLADSEVERSAAT